MPPQHREVTDWQFLTTTRKILNPFQKYINLSYIPSSITIARKLNIITFILCHIKNIYGNEFTLMVKKSWFQLHWIINSTETLIILFCWENKVKRTYFERELRLTSKGKKQKQGLRQGLSTKGRVGHDILPGFKGATKKPLVRR